MADETVQATPPIAEWAIVELMGHVRMAGLVSEEQHFGATLGRIDIPQGEGFATQFFGGGSVYRISPCSEEVARAVAVRNQPAPVQRWELPAPTISVVEDDEIDEPDRDYDLEPF